jgi:hypothetical protein
MNKDLEINTGKINNILTMSNTSTRLTLINVDKGNNSKIIVIPLKLDLCLIYSTVQITIYPRPKNDPITGPKRYTVEVISGKYEGLIYDTDILEDEEK